MISTILGILGTGLKIWKHKEKTKYLEKFIKIERTIHEERKKPLNLRDNAVIDNAEFELYILSKAWVATVKGSDS